MLDNARRQFIFELCNSFFRDRRVIELDVFEVRRSPQVTQTHIRDRCGIEVQVLKFRQFAQLSQADGDDNEHESR
jgi:hypothetical protein